AMKAAAHVFEPNTVVRWRSEPARGSPYGTGHRKFVGDNPPRGAQIFYALAKKADKIGLKVVDYAGQTVHDLPVKNEPGLHQAVWDLTRAAARSGTDGRAAGTPAARTGRPRQPSAEGGGGGPVAPGLYRVVLTVNGNDLTQTVRVEADPT